VIFVLLASSLIGILTMNFVKQMVSYTNDMSVYNSSYYYAKAGIELALTEVDSAWIWFSNKISTWSDIFKDNFKCKNCDFNINIIWKTNNLSDKFWLWSTCNDENAFVLQWWESIILPFFVQTGINKNIDAFSDDILYDKSVLRYRDHLNLVSNQDYNGKFNLWLIVVLDNDVQKDLLFMKSLDGSLDMFQQYFQAYDDYYWSDVLGNDDYLVYLVVSNAWEENSSFCIDIDNINIAGKLLNLNISADKFFIKSLWYKWDKVIWLSAIYGQSLPKFLVNSYSK